MRPEHDPKVMKAISRLRTYQTRRVQRLCSRRIPLLGVALVREKRRRNPFLMDTDALINCAALYLAARRPSLSAKLDEMAQDYAEGRPIDENSAEFRAFLRARGWIRYLVGAGWSGQVSDKPKPPSPEQMLHVGLVLTLAGQRPPRRYMREGHAARLQQGN